MSNLMNSGSQKATISDVARLAGVSIKTVSRVANGERNVRPATRSRVQAAIDELNYRANPYARYLSSLRAQPSVTPLAETPDTTTG